MTIFKRRVLTLILMIGATYLSFITCFTLNKKMNDFDYLSSFSTTNNIYDILRGIHGMLFIAFVFLTVYFIYLLIWYREKVYDKLFCSYKAIGIVERIRNSTGAFVDVIFIKNGKYYIQEEYYNPDKNVKKIKSFVSFTGETKKIIPLTEFYVDIPKTAIIGDKLLLGFRYKKNHLIITNIHQTERFLKQNGFEDLIKTL